MWRLNTATAMCTDAKVVLVECAAFAVSVQSKRICITACICLVCESLKCEYQISRFPLNWPKMSEANAKRACTLHYRWSHVLTAGHASNIYARRTKKHHSTMRNVYGRFVACARTVVQCCLRNSVRMQWYVRGGLSAKHQFGPASEWDHRIRNARFAVVINNRSNRFERFDSHDGSSEWYALFMFCQRAAVEWIIGWTEPTRRRVLLCAQYVRTYQSGGHIVQRPIRARVRSPRALCSAINARVHACAIVTHTNYLRITFRFSVACVLAHTQRSRWLLLRMHGRR